ncbi:unnamed protein product [Mytilus coruscus]|uniref:C1q domain-containing protein n=1 Tax=Mytilus coruscus TaxID=42192 RepID=A0A6J8AEB5_MYTCO|nr:unnamed protein product [Mytilus coruscus]
MKQQQTEIMLQSVLSSANARSQDFLALLNKLKISDNRTIELQSELHNTSNRFNLTVSNLNRRFKKSNAGNAHDSEFFLTVLSAQLTSSGTVASYADIPFKQVQTSHGIHDLTSIRKDGKFTCEKPGLYLISVCVTTNANSNGYYYVYKNKNLQPRHTDIHNHML